MDLKSTQLKDTYGNLLTIGESAGSPTTGTLENGDGEDITALDVAGTITSDGLTVDGDATIALDLNVGGAVKGNAGTRAVSIGTAGSVIGGLQLWSTTSGTSYFQFGDESGTPSNHYRGYISYNHANDSMALGTASATKVTLDSSGNVGIGETNPDASFTVSSGNANNVANFKSSDGTAYIAIADSGSTSALHNQIGVIGDDMYFATDDTERLRIDSLGRVGIGETNPDRELDLKNSADNCIMSITSSTSHLSGLVLGDTADDDRGGILYNNTSDYLYFLSNAQERMRIDSSGNVGIGTDSPDAQLELETASAPSVIRLSRKTTTNDGDAIGQIDFRDNASGGTFARVEGLTTDNTGGSLDGALVFWVTKANSFTEAMRIENGNLDMSAGGGNIILDSGAGIDFSDTANSSGTMTSELLDDYEEGTWTPAWSFATSGSATISIDSATYTKIGRVVNVNARFNTSSISSPVGTATLTGLPFTANSTIYDVPGSVSELLRWATDIQNLKVFVINNQSYLEMTFNSATDTNATNLSGSDFSTSAGARNIISISVTYFV